MISDMHATVRQLFAGARSPIYDFKHFRYYLNKVPGLPQSFYKDLWKSPAPDDLINDGMIEPYTQGGADYGKMAIRSVTSKVPFLEYFYSRAAKKSICTINDLVNQYGDYHVGLINHVLERDPLIEDINGIDIYNYVMSEKPITKKTDVDIDRDYVDHSKYRLLCTSLPTFSLISLKINDCWTYSFLMKDFYIYQNWQVWPVMYFRGQELNNNFADEYHDKYDVRHASYGDKHALNGIIMHNPLYDYYYLLTYYWKCIKGNGIFKHTTFILNTNHFIELTPSIHNLLRHKLKFNNFLHKCLFNNYISSFQVPHWFYGPHSYIYKPMLMYNRYAGYHYYSNQYHNEKKSYLPLVNQLLDGASCYDCITNANEGGVFDAFFDFVKKHTRHVPMKYDPKRSYKTIKRGKIVYLRIDYSPFPDHVNRDSMRFIGDKEEKYHNSTGVYLLYGRDKDTNNWILKVGRAHPLKNRERLYSITAQTADNHFNPKVPVLLLDFFSEVDMNTTFTTAQYYGAEAVFRTVFHNIGSSLPNSSEWFPTDNGYYDALKAAFENIKYQLLQDKGWRQKCNKIGFQKIAGYVKDHLDEFITMPNIKLSAKTTKTSSDKKTAKK